MEDAMDFFYVAFRHPIFTGHSVTKAGISEDPCLWH